MKSRPLFFSRLLLPAALISFSGSAQALTKANNATSLNAAGSWAEAAAPSSTDVLLFNSTGVPTAGGLTVGVGASATVGGSLQVTDIAGNLSITQSTGATWTLGNGGIDMSAATADVTIGGSGKNLRWANGNYGGISVAAGRTLTLNSNFSNQGNTKTIAMTGSGNIIFNGSAGFGGATSFNVNGANVTLNNASGGWTAGTITAGSLVIGNTNALQNQTVTNNAAAGIKFGTGITSATLGNLAGSGSIELTNADTNAVSLAIGGNNSSQTYSGSLSGAGTLTKNGTGTLTLSGSSSAYTGGVALNSGTLSIGNSNGAGTGASTITALTGTTVFANSGLGGNAIAAAITLSGTSANVILTNANASGGFGSAISGSADQTLTISQAGGANVNLNASTKQLQNFNGTVAIASGQNVAFRATSLNNGSDNALFEVNGNLSTRNSGAVALGALTGSGTLGMGGAGLSGQNLTYTIGARGTDATFSGVIQDGDTGGNKLVNVSKTGAGVQTLSGASTYTGATTVSAGSLLINGSLGNTAVAVNSGGTLAGSNGTIGSGTATVTVNTGGTLAPGNSPGTLTVNGAATLNSGSTYAYQYTGGASAADLLDVNGALTINVGAILTLQELGVYTSGSKFTLFAYESLTGSFAAYADDQTYSFNGGDWTFNYNDSTAGLNGGTVSGAVGSGFVTMTAVPEPNAAMLVGGLGLLGLLRRRRNG